MFEDVQREDVEAFMGASVEFRWLYQKHKQLDSKVHDAEVGLLPMDSRTLAGMKRHKLVAKDRLQQLWDAHAQQGELNTMRPADWNSV